MGKERERKERETNMQGKSGNEGEERKRQGGGEGERGRRGEGEEGREVYHDVGRSFEKRKKEFEKRVQALFNVRRGGGGEG